jgi:hypothetical protein
MELNAGEAKCNRIFRPLSGDVSDTPDAGSYLSDGYLKRYIRGLRCTFIRPSLGILFSTKTRHSLQHDSSQVAQLAMPLRYLPRILFIFSILARTAWGQIHSGMTGDALTCSKQMGFPVLKFIVTYYIAHAFTIRFKPGFGPFYTLIFSLLALFFPYFGLILACRSMEYLAIFADNPLDTALKAGGLCTVARTRDWKPEMDGDQLVFHELVNPMAEPEDICWLTKIV